MPLKLLVRQLVEADHNPCSLIQHSGFARKFEGCPTPGGPLEQLVISR